MYSQQLAKELLDLIIKHEMLPFQKKLESMAKGELLILNYLYQHEDGGLPSEISRQVNVSCARITAIASSLEKKAMVLRQISNQNRREVHLFITETGRNYLENHYQEVSAQVAKLLEFLGEEDARHYLRITRRLLEFPLNHQ